MRLCGRRCAGASGDRCGMIVNGNERKPSGYFNTYTGVLIVSTAILGSKERRSGYFAGYVHVHSRGAIGCVQNCHQTPTNRNLHLASSQRYVGIAMHQAIHSRALSHAHTPSQSRRASMPTHRLHPSVHRRLPNWDCCYCAVCSSLDNLPECLN